MVIANRVMEQQELVEQNHVVPNVAAAIRHDRIAGLDPGLVAAGDSGSTEATAGYS